MNDHKIRFLITGIWYWSSYK